MAEDGVFFLCGNEADRLELVEPDSAVIRSVEFPSIWFNTAGNTKPVIKVTPGTLTANGHVRGTVLKDLYAGRLSRDVAVTFVMQEFSQKPAINSEEWTSFSRIIIRAGEMGTIRDIFKLDETEAPSAYSAEARMSKAEIVRALFTICTIYRLSTISIPEYRDRVCNSANKLLTDEGFEAVEFQTFASEYRHWMSYAPFRMIVAGVDMFLHRFPEHEFSIIRFGTIPSRFRDCSGLTEIHTFRELMTMSFKELSRWIWHEKLGIQLMRILKTGQESDKDSSYCMYLMDMFFSKKSPYGAGANPELHFYVNMILASLGHARGKNAKVAGNLDTTIPYHTAAIYIFCKGRGGKFGRVFGARNDQVDYDDAGNDIVDPTTLPDNNDPMVWLGYLQQHNGITPKPILRYLAGKWRQFNNCREGTIGHWLYQEALQILEDTT